MKLTLTSTTSSPVTIAKTAVIATLWNLNVVGSYAIPYQITIPVGAGQKVTTSGYLRTTFPTNAVRGMFSSIGIAVLD